MQQLNGFLLATARCSDEEVVQEAMKALPKNTDLRQLLRYIVDPMHSEVGVTTLFRVEEAQDLANFWRALAAIYSGLRNQDPNNRTRSFARALAFMSPEWAKGENLDAQYIYYLRMLGLMVTREQGLDYSTSQTLLGIETGLRLGWMEAHGWAAFLLERYVNRNDCTAAHTLLDKLERLGYNRVAGLEQLPRLRAHFH
ncbi:MAG: hypothetical protein QG626_845 [Patescibacteria group bacterium]|jgi:hypothetical protein|nr:hypothetical protein [Patescibacteria group bacterium]